MAAGLRKLLFICSQNRLRSPTAEQIFSQRGGYEALSAGTNNDAETPLDGELLDWADVIFVMEKSHLTKVRHRFGEKVRGKRIVCLDIPDEYEFMDPALVRLLETRVSRYLG